MSKRIVNYFINKRWRDRDIHFYIKWNVVSFIMLSLSLFLVNAFKNYDENAVFLSYTLLSVIMFFNGIIIFFYKGSSFKTLFYGTLHVLMSKERTEREIMINQSFVSSTVPQKKEKSVVNKNEYIRKYISDKQSMIAFFQERDVRNNLILWSEFLPLARVNLDYKKQMLSHDRMDKKVKCPLSKNELEYKFSLYSEKELIRLFCSYYNFEDYMYCLESEFKEAFPVKDSIKDLRDCIMDINEKDYLIEEEYPWVKNLDECFRVIKNKRELYDWADIMQNCLKGYDERLKKKKTIVLAYVEQGNIQYIVEVIPEKGLVKELKGYKNSEPFKSEELMIKKSIMNTFKKST